MTESLLSAEEQRQSLALAAQPASIQADLAAQPAVQVPVMVVPVTVNPVPLQSGPLIPNANGPSIVVVHRPQQIERIDPVPFHRALLTNPGIPTWEIIKWSVFAVIGTVLFSIKPLICIIYSGRSYCKNETLRDARMLVVVSFTLPITALFVVLINIWLRFSLIPLTNACIAALKPHSLLGSANPDLRLKFVELSTWYSNFLIGGICGVMLSNYLIQFIANFMRFKLIADLTIDNVIAGVSSEYGVFVMVLFYLPVWLVFFSLCLFTHLCYSLQCAAVASGVELPSDVVYADPFSLITSPNISGFWAISNLKHIVIQRLDQWFSAQIMCEIKRSGGRSSSPFLSLPTNLSDSSVAMAHFYIVCRHALSTWAYFQLLLVWFGKTVTGLGMLWNGVLFLVTLFGSKNGGFQAWGVLIPLVSVFTGVTWGVSSFKMRRATRVIQQTVFEAKVSVLSHCPAGDDGFKAFDAVREAMLTVDANGQPLTDIRSLVRFYDSSDPETISIEDQSSVNAAVAPAASVFPVPIVHSAADSAGHQSGANLDEPLLVDNEQEPRQELESAQSEEVMGPLSDANGLSDEMVAHLHTNGGRNMLSVPSARTRQWWTWENRVCNIHGAITLIFLIYYLNELATANKINGEIRGVTSTLCVFAICQTSSGLLVQCFSDAIQSRSNVFGKSLLECLLIFFIRRSHQLQNMTESTVSKSHFQTCESVFIILALTNLIIIVFGLCFSEPIFIVAMKRVLIDPFSDYSWFRIPSVILDYIQSKVYIKHEEIFDRIIPGICPLFENGYCSFIRNSTLFAVSFVLSLLNLSVLCVFLISKASQSSLFKWTAIQLVYPMVWLLFALLFQNECRQLIELYLYIPELKAMKPEHVKRLNSGRSMIQAFIPLLFAICVVVFGYTAEFASRAGIGFLSLQMFICLPLFSLSVWQH